MNQPAPSYTLDPQQARKGSEIGGSTIKSTGGYVGKITLAKFIRASTGSIGIGLSFVSDAGEKASHLSLYTRDKDDESLMGDAKRDALMVCMKLRDIAPKTATIKEFDYTKKQEVDVVATIYPDLMDKRIGLVLQMEQYKKNDGSVGESMKYISAYDPNTLQMADEILDQLPAKRLDKLLATLSDKLLPASPNPNTSSVSHTDFDDDIPF